MIAQIKTIKTNKPNIYLKNTALNTTQFKKIMKNSDQTASSLARGFWSALVPINRKPLASEDDQKVKKK